ncbi:hypothetical protein [Xanthomonas citri]|uniref:Uncharacterized protein n=1 Tax=Xanthomonas citri pv. citri TaxID=611301 RepID=A0A0U5F920_XANCI|nr:hypothetical protein [Xanthomonas citri]ARR15340.1 hypothetical protein B7L66_24560 [Xanthomonas citri pv. citri]ARR20083.1 hypothetical protein B7L65_24920 [Xanthomonas citri pv. citri]ARR24634.1 hypothetical protein B7L67_24320 [Xanthomonas citri pv. citri]CEG14695.1 conserved hypothetical protein [Xanthomonas citri pv. citri]
MQPLSHAQLVDLGARWVRREGFGVVATEVVAVGCREQADVIGLRATCSAVIEAKASRADFLADWAKPHRHTGGLGLYRFFACPEGLIDLAELTKGWGLLYATSRSIRAVVRPPGNIWPRRDAASAAWEAFQHQSNDSAERSVLYSIARRLAGQAGVVRGRSRKT